MIKCGASRTFYHFFATGLINSIIQEHKCKILFIMTLKITLQISIWCEKVKMLPSFRQRYNGPHYVTLLNL